MNGGIKVELQPRYQLKKLSIGVVSVVAGMTATALTAHADDQQPTNNQSVQEQAIQSTSVTQPYSAPMGTSTQVSKYANNMTTEKETTNELNVMGGGNSNQVTKDASINQPVLPASALTESKVTSISSVRDAWHLTINYQWATSDDPKDPQYHGLPKEYSGKSPYSQNTVITMTPREVNGVPSGVDVTQTGTKVNITGVQDLGNVIGNGQQEGNINLEAGKTYRKYQFKITWPEYSEQVKTDPSGFTETMYTQVLPNGKVSWMSPDQSTTVKYYQLYNQIKIRYVDSNGKVIKTVDGQPLFPDKQKVGVFWENEMPDKYGLDQKKGSGIVYNLTWDGKTISGDGNGWAINSKDDTVLVTVPVTDTWSPTLVFDYMDWGPSHIDQDSVSHPDDPSWMTVSSVLSWDETPISVGNLTIGERCDITKLLPKGYSYAFAPFAKKVEIQLDGGDQVSIFADGKYVGKSSEIGLSLPLLFIPGHIYTEISYDSGLANVVVDVDKKTGKKTTLAEYAQYENNSLQNLSNDYNSLLDEYVNYLKSLDFSSKKYDYSMDFSSYFDLQKIIGGPKSALSNGLEYSLLTRLVAGNETLRDAIGTDLFYKNNPQFVNSLRETNADKVYVKSFDGLFDPIWNTSIFDDLLPKKRPTKNELDKWLIRAEAEKPLDNEDHHYKIVYTTTPEIIGKTTVTLVDDDSSGAIVGNPLNISGSANQKLKLSVLIPTGYQVVSTMPDYVQFDGNAHANPIVIHLKHQVTQENPEYKVATRTIVVNDPRTAPYTAIKQFAKLVRYSGKDMVTGKAKVSDWQPVNQFDSFKAPVIDKYRTTTPVIAVANPDINKLQQTVYINYEPAEIPATVFLNMYDLNGNRVKTQTFNGTVGKPLQLSLSIPDNYQLQAGQTANPTITPTQANESVDYVLAHRVTRQESIPEWSKAATVRVHINLPGGHTEEEGYAVRYYHYEYVDQVTNQSVGDEYVPKVFDNNGNFMYEGIDMPKIVAPKVDGYQAVVSESVSYDENNQHVHTAGVTINPEFDLTSPQLILDRFNSGSRDFDFTVTYHPIQRSYTVNYVDHAGKVIFSQQVTSGSDVALKAPVGYHLLTTKTTVKSLVGDMKNLQADVLVAPDVTTYVANGKNIPSNVDQLTKTVTRTVKIVMPNGHTRTINQRVKFDRVATVDSAGKITYSDWKAIGHDSFNRVFIPHYVGYRVDGVVNAVGNVNANDQNSVVMVKYVKL